MSKPKPELEHGERALWQAALEGAEPLRSRRRVPPPRPAPLQPGRRQQDHAEVMHEALHGDIAPEDFNTGDEDEFRRDGIARNTLRKLRRGQFAIQASLDLHGLTRPQAHQALTGLLQQARVRDWRCIKIIHGKGLRSPQGLPVLKRRVEITLQRCNDVLAYCSAPPWAGGHGATLVLLRRGG